MTVPGGNAAPTLTAELERGHSVDESSSYYILNRKEVEAKSPDCLAAAKTMFNNSHFLDELDCLAEEERLQRKLLLGWNQFAAVSKGMGVPDIIAPGFKRRDDCWEEELAAPNKRTNV
eukprot:Stramenopile-MAST_4_protein_6358